MRTSRFLGRFSITFDFNLHTSNGHRLKENGYHQLQQNAAVGFYSPSLTESQSQILNCRFDLILKEPGDNKKISPRPGLNNHVSEMFEEEEEHIALVWEFDVHTPMLTVCELLGSV